MWLIWYNYYMINKVILVGDAWKDPIERTTTKTNMCILHLVTKEYTLDNKNTGTDKIYVEKKEWHNIVAFGTTAEYILKNIHLGDIVYVEGQIQTREIPEKDGEAKKYVKEVIINRNGVVKKLYSKKRDINNSFSQEESASLTLDNEEDELLF